MPLASMLKVLAIAASLAAVPVAASAQAYPTRAVRIIVPAPPGGAIDTIARVVGDKIGAAMGQPVIVDNRPGASNNLGTDVLAKATPDGYTIGIVGGSHNINKFLFRNLGWDPEKSFEPIVYTHEVPLVFAIAPQIPARTLPEFVAWMKAHPDDAKVATSGRGSAQEMAAEMFRLASGAPMLLVPYKGSSAAHPDLLAGRTALFIDTISAIQAQVKAGNVRAIAVSTARRSSSLPDVPTADEQGLKGYDANTNGGFLAPAGTPRAIVDRLNTEINAALKLPDVRAKLEAAGIEVQGGTPQA
jgi:tripartite-type tricarboxylate transporter receptor subunit TctC